MISRRSVLAGLAVAPLAACASISPTALATLGSRVDKGKVDFGLLHQLARRADDSQRDEATIRANWPDTVRTGRIQKVDVRYVFGEDPARKAQYLAMPGSLSVKDWLEDFDFSLKPEARNGLPLHRGFEDSALATYAEIRPLLKRDHKVHIAGYSMGAGVAAVLTLYLIEDGYSVYTATYGQPRVTNAVGAARMAQLPITRVVNVDDFVSMVPTFPFEHFGEEVILHPGSDYVYLSHDNANRISIGEVWREKHGLSITNHASELYVARLAEKIAAANPVPYLTRLA